MNVIHAVTFVGEVEWCVLEVYGENTWESSASTSRPGGKQVINALPTHGRRMRRGKTSYQRVAKRLPKPSPVRKDNLPDGYIKDNSIIEQSGWRTCKQATHKTRGWNQYNQRKREFSFFFFFFWHHVLFRLFFFLLVTVSSTLLTAYEAPEPATAAPSALPPATSAGTRAAKGSTPPFCQRRRLLDLFSSWFTRRLNLTRFMMVRRMDMAQIQWVQVFLYDLGSCRR